MQCRAMATHTGMKQGEMVWAIMGSTVGSCAQLAASHQILEQ